MTAAVAYLKKEKVLSIALILAVLSALIIHPDKNYIEYIDVRVLAILFGLMLVVKGFQDVGMFDVLIEKLFGGVSGTRKLALILVWICFFISMLITNDVALITFVPFAIMTLRLCKETKLMVQIIVLQTLAANLGSMCTPVGNPQNLYLFSVSGMSVGTFFATMLPLAILSLVLLTVAIFLLIPAEKLEMTAGEHAAELNKKELIMYVLLFIVNLLVVVRIISWQPALIITVIGVCILHKQGLLKKVDYSLLITFVGFFIFVGNLGRIGFINTMIGHVLQSREVLVSALFSQCLSNVPAAILLSGFTDNYAGLLAGTNIGGMGTLIASMASLISYKLYAVEPDADKGRYMFVFTLENIVGFIILMVFAYFWY